MKVDNSHFLSLGTHTRADLAHKIAVLPPGPDLLGHPEDALHLHQIIPPPVLDWRPAVAQQVVHPHRETMRKGGTLQEPLDYSMDTLIGLVPRTHFDAPATRRPCWVADAHPRASLNIQLVRLVVVVDDHLVAMGNGLRRAFPGALLTHLAVVRKVEVDGLVRLPRQGRGDRRGLEPRAQGGGEHGVSAPGTPAPP